MSKPVAFIVVENGQTWLRTTAETEEAIRTGFITETIPLYKQREPLSTKQAEDLWETTFKSAVPYYIFDEICVAIEQYHGIGVDDE